MFRIVKKIGIVTLGLLLGVFLLNVDDIALATVPGVNDRISLSSTGAQITWGSSAYGLVSPNGNVAVFYSTSANVLPTGGQGVFVRNLLSGATNRVNVSTAGVIDNGGGSTIPEQISATGRYIGFQSFGTNLIDGVTTPATTSNKQLYIRDITSSTTTLISQSLSGVISNGNFTSMEGISSDGRFVLYYSNATNLHPDATDGYSHVYMLDRLENSLSVLDRKTDGTLGMAGTYVMASMSCDGSIVAFQHGDVLTSTDTNSSSSIYLLDRRGSTDRLTDITASANRGVYGPSVSCNGDFIGFKSAAVNIDPSVSATYDPGVYRPYIYDRVNNTYNMASIATSGAAVNSAVCNTYANAGAPCIEVSDTGVGVFSAKNPDLTGASKWQVYIRNVYTGVTEIVSRNASGVASNATGDPGPDITADGSAVVYSSSATNLVSNDTNGEGDVFRSLTGY